MGPPRQQVWQLAAASDLPDCQKTLQCISPGELLRLPLHSHMLRHHQQLVAPPAVAAVAAAGASAPRPLPFLKRHHGMTNVGAGAGCCGRAPCAACDDFLMPVEAATRDGGTATQSGMTAQSGAPRRWHVHGSCCQQLQGLQPSRRIRPPLLLPPRANASSRCLLWHHCFSDHMAQLLVWCRQSCPLCRNRWQPMAQCHSTSCPQVRAASRWRVRLRPRMQPPRQLQPRPLRAHAGVLRMALLVNRHGCRQK